MTEWREVALGDVLTLQRGFDITRASQRDGNIPVVSSSGVNSYHNEAKVEGPGVVIGRKGSLGTCFYLERAFWPHDTTLWVKDFKGNDPKFCYFLLQGMGLEQHDVGAANPTLNRNHVHLLPVLLPEPSEQRRIAGILGAYDDLIEVNRRRVAVLEDMARGLFEEWFVRLRFPGHESVALHDTPDGPLPEGWRFAGLRDVAEVGFGYAFKSKQFSTEPLGVRVVRIRDVLEGTTGTWTQEPFEARYKVVNGDILIGMDGIFHTAMWVGGDAALNQRVTRLRPLNGHSRGWVFLATYPHIKYFEATISGTTVAHLGAKHLSMIKLRVADQQTQAKADEFFAAIDAELINLRVTNHRLAESRDLLLPRLMSGQLSVAQAEMEAGAQKELEIA